MSQIPQKRTTPARRRRLCFCQPIVGARNCALHNNIYSIYGVTRTSHTCKHDIKHHWVLPSTRRAEKKCRGRHSGAPHRVRLRLPWRSTQLIERASTGKGTIPQKAQTNKAGHIFLRKIVARIFFLPGARTCTYLVAGTYEFKIGLVCRFIFIYFWEFYCLLTASSQATLQAHPDKSRQKNSKIYG